MFRGEPVDVLCETVVKEAPVKETELIVGVVAPVAVVEMVVHDPAVCAAHHARNLIGTVRPSFDGGIFIMKGFQPHLLCHANIRLGVVAHMDDAGRVGPRSLGIVLQ